MSQVNGKLSSRVMNMKFMRFTKQENADDNDVTSNEEEKKSLLHDNSEWNLRDTNEAKQDKKRVIVLKRTKNLGISAPQRSVLGITKLKCEDSIVRGRRVIGEAKKVDDDGGSKTNKRERADDVGDDDYDLDKIFKQVKDEKKHKKR